MAVAAVSVCLRVCMERCVIRADFAPSHSPPNAPVLISGLAEATAAMLLRPHVMSTRRLDSFTASLSRRKQRLNFLSNWR